MRNYCTLADKNYLLQAKVMCDSLIRESSNKELNIFFLCLDQETIDVIGNWTKHKEHIIPIPLHLIEATYPELLGYKKNNPWNKYCWILASFLCRYSLMVVGAKDILYVDSDIYFYQDPEAIFAEVSGFSIGIIRHRHNTAKSPDGEFNVGIVYFQNDNCGRECIEWWTTTMVEGLEPELDSCGDQKYLERFETKWPMSTRVIEGIGHGAPWNFRLYCYDYYMDQGVIIWGKEYQKLIFNHFSRFQYDLEKMTMVPTGGQYSDHTLNFQVFNIPEVKQMYIDYFLELKKMQMAS